MNSLMSKPPKYTLILLKTTNNDKYIVNYSLFTIVMPVGWVGVFPGYNLTLFQQKMFLDKHINPDVIY